LEKSGQPEIIAPMKEQAGSAENEIFLGIEGGGTRTVAIAAHHAGELLRKIEAGPSNLRLLSNEQLVRLFRSICAKMPMPSCIGIGLAGARTASDKQRISQAAQKVWPGIPCYATNDLETGLMAAPEVPGSAGRILVLSGTGSCCFGRRPDGHTAKVGGWGHLLGDRGSGYEIGLRALQAVIHEYDCWGVWPKLGRSFLRAIELNEPDDLIGWTQKAGKAEIAALATEVFAAGKKHDILAAGVLAHAASRLAQDAFTCALNLVKPKTQAQFIFAGSVLLKQPEFAKEVGQSLKRIWPKALITPLERESAWGAVELAKHIGLGNSRQHFGVSVRKHPAAKLSSAPDECSPPPDVQQLLASPTEQRNPRSVNLDKLPLLDAIKLMLDEESKTPPAVLAEAGKIERVIGWIVRAFCKGGRLFYAGAGTSGRLGVLDASECPPTFNASPEMVQGIIAGGQRALWESIEGAEDDPDAGARAIAFRDVDKRDVVVGIAASGRTPFVWGALSEARRRGAKAILLTFNPNLKILPEKQPDLVIAPNVGPEILTGSTRLKSGTATKLVLNTLTTLSMVRLGKVQSNLMIDVKATNVKLRDRATRIVQELTQADYQTARAALEKAHWHIKTAAARLHRKRG
jgi:N-acetylmuramic acid 6-phosphate etherase